MQEAEVKSSAPSVLIVDDDARIRELCSTIVSTRGLQPFEAGDGQAASELVGRLNPDYVLLDVNLPGRSGMEILREIRVRFPAIRVVMITGYAAVDLAVEAMKLGAYDYIAKPFTPNRLLEVLCATDRPPLTGETPPAAPATRSFAGMVGVSSAIQHIYELVDKAARCDSTVLLEGESGTGKEVAARAIHQRSSRVNAPFVPVNCGAISPGLIESELFGHLAGAFTDAKQDKQGLLRSAENGTVFLDEIGELPTTVQVKLLRALQEMEVRPVGSSQSHRFNARIIAATNRNLSQEVARGSFRRDLFYRLHVVPVFLPPLRERREDIPILVEHFLQTYGDRASRRLGIAPDSLRHLMRYDWPGNVRELENVIQRAFALVDGDEIKLSDMPTLFPRHTLRTQPRPSEHSPEPEPGAGEARPVEHASRGNLMAAQEEQAIRTALDQAGGNKREATRILGIGIATLYRKLKKYGIET